MPKLSRFRQVLPAVIVAAWALVSSPIGQAQTAHQDEAQGTGTGPAVEKAIDQEKALHEAVKANPKDPEPHIKLAQFYRANGNYSAEEGEAREAIELGATASDVADVLAWALMMESKETELFAQIAPADRDPPVESTVRVSLGLAHLNLHEFREAEPLLRDAVRLDGQNRVARLALAKYLLDAGDFSGAREQIEAAGAISPNNLGIKRLLGELYRDEGKNEDAAAEFVEVLKEDPTNYQGLVGHADALISLNKFAEANVDVDLIFKVERGNAEGIYLRALILAREGKAADADNLLNVISGRLGQGARAYYLTGVVDFLRNQPELADTFLSRAAARQPSVSGPTRLRAEIALRRGSPRDAIDLLKPIVDAAPSDAAAATILARAYAANGDPDQALDVLRGAVNAQSGSGTNPPVAATAKPTDRADLVDMAEIDKVAFPEQGAQAVTPLLVLTELSQGHLEKASGDAEDLAKALPDEPVDADLLGSVRLAQNRLPEAESIFRGIVTKNPTFVAASRNLAKVLEAENRPGEAKAVLQGAPSSVK